jgi:ABC-2 type transport system permease protein
MSKVWLIAQQHYRQEALKRGFLIVMFSLPLFLLFAVGMGMLTDSLESDSTTLGYVDEAGVLVTMLPEPEEVHLVSFETAELAQAALEEEAIAGYYVIPADYSPGGKVDFVYFEQNPWRARNHFRQVVRANLLAGQPPEIADRALPGPSVTVRATSYNREFPQGNPSAGQVAPLVVGVVFAFLTLSTTGYLMSVLVKEKENRTVEIIVSSISINRMMLGKILAGVAIGLTLLVVWGVFFAGAAWLGRSVLEVAWLQDIDISWRDVFAVVAVAVPSYLVIAAMMTMVGTVVGSQAEADQIGPFIFLIMLVPLYLIIPIGQNPNGALAIGLSLFPPTSVMTVAFRSLFREVPMWQIVASAATGLASAIALIWLAGKAFRTSLLRYGQRLRLGELFRSGSNGGSVRSAAREV